MNGELAFSRAKMPGVEHAEHKLYLIAVTRTKLLP
jgi:hypothetical protein